MGVSVVRVMLGILGGCIVVKVGLGGTLSGVSFEECVAVKRISSTNCDPDGVREPSMFGVCLVIGCEDHTVLTTGWFANRSGACPTEKCREIEDSRSASSEAFP